MSSFNYYALPSSQNVLPYLPNFRTFKKQLINNKKHGPPMHALKSLFNEKVFLQKSFLSSNI